MTDDRQQHINTLARAMCKCHPAEDDSLHCSWWRAAAIFDSTDPAVHDALVAALHANADRARLLAAHADAGWLDEDRQWVPVARSGDRWKGRTKDEAEDAMAAYPVGGTYSSGDEWDGITHIEQERRFRTEWEPTP